MRLPTSALICLILLLPACQQAEDPQAETPPALIAADGSAARHAAQAIDALADEYVQAYFKLFPEDALMSGAPDPDPALGKQFDIRAFHDLVLKDGAIPLSQLGDKVQRWVEEQ